MMKWKLIPAWRIFITYYTPEESWEKQKVNKTLELLNAVKEEEFKKNCTFKPKVHHKSHKSITKSIINPTSLIDSNRVFELYLKEFQNSDKNPIAPDMWYKHNDEEQLLLSAEKIENHKASLFSQLLLDPQIKSIPKNKHSKSFKSIAPTENYFFNDYESVDLESKDWAKGIIFKKNKLCILS